MMYIYEQGKRLVDFPKAQGRIDLMRVDVPQGISKIPKVPD